MAVNPLSTPLKTEYKPLGLEAFAQPLSDMQAKFDTVKQEIEATDFALSRLSQDDPRAKDLLKEIESKRDELAENLMTTGNYRQASSKLLELNKVYNKDEETNAIKGNYESYQKAAKEQKERVAKGDITQQDYDLWDFRVKHSFQGTQYDKASDTYSSINVHPRMKNMEKELREESLKLAGMAEKQTVEELQRRGINAFTVETLQVMKEHRGLDQVAREIEQFLKTSDQYKNWVNEDADYKWYYNTNTDPEFKEKYISSVLDQYDERIGAYSEYLKDPQQAATAQKEIARLEKDKNNLLGLAQQSLQEGTFDNFAKTVFMDQAQGRFKSTAFGASDIVDMEKLTLDVSDRTDEAAKGKADEALKKLQEVGTVATNIAANAGESNTTIISGTATSSRDENAALANYRKDAFTMMKNSTTDNVPDLKDKTIKVAVSPEEEKTFNKTLETSKDLFVTLGRMNNFNNEIKNRDAEITLKKEELAKAKSSEEKKQITAELNNMYQDKEELKLALVDDTKTFDNILDAEINKSYVSPELKKLYETEYKSDPVKFLRTLREHSNSFLEAHSSVGVPEEAARLELERNAAIQDAIAKAKEQNLNLTEEDIIKRFPIVTPKLAVAQDDFTMLANNVMDAYKWNLSAKFDTIGSEVIMNKNLNVMTDGAVDEIVQYVKENTRGKSDVKKVSYNILTGESKKDESGNQFDLEGCYNPTPHFAGVDKNGDIILRYVLKSDFDPETKTAKTAVANYIKNKKGLPETDLSIPADSEIAAFRKANPTDLYVAVEGRSKQLVQNAEKNYVDIAEAGIAYNDGEVITQNLHNYAPIHVNSNAERKENYYKMAARLVDAQRNGHKFTEIVQAPAAWKDNGDNTFTAFQITYKVQDGSVIAQINQGFMGADKKVTWSALTSKILDETANNMPNALAAMDLVYGTGREEDLVNTQRGFNTTIFVPAFENPGIALQGPTGFLGK